MIGDGTEALVERASGPGEGTPTPRHNQVQQDATLPSRSSGAPTSNTSPGESVGEWNPAKVRECPKRCEFMISMDPEGAPRHQCPNPPLTLMELDLGVAPIYRWACEAHANERVVPIRAMIVRRFRGQE